MSAMSHVANEARYQPMGQQFDVGDPFYVYSFQRSYESRLMHVWCAGDVSSDPSVPIVWFEHGWMGSSLDWHLVHHKMKDHTRVCSYDRSGYGWSNPGPRGASRTAEQIVRELEKLLEAAEDYVWKDDAVGRAGGRKIALCGHSMAGFQMRIFQDRNPELVQSILFADAVNPDYVKGAGFGNRYPSNPMNPIGSYFLVPQLTWLLFAGGGVSSLDDTKGVTDVESFSFRYAYIVTRSVWFETADDEWVAWPEHAARTSECGANRDGKLGDLPIWVFVAKMSTAFDSYKETLALSELSTRSNVTILPEAEHTFIFEERYTEELVDALLYLLEL
jgi:pimeloyl-ACP methyl ester carboxylesterase